MKVSALLRDVARSFTRAKLHFGHGTHDAREEAAWLISSVLGFLLEQELTPSQVSSVREIAKQRIGTRKPLAYLLHEAWLGEHSFYVDERVLVPRSFIAELVREEFSPWLPKAPQSALDLCTGSGCLAILLAEQFPRVRVDAADLSAAALAVARKNIRKHKVGKRVKAVQSDLFKKLKGRTYDLIITNPPYVTAASMKKLPAEYRHEPALGLAAGRDGLDLVRRIIEQAAAHLNPGGLLVCEIGGNRAALERAYPDLEFVWPELSEGPGAVFILPREGLPAAAAPARPSRRPPDRPGRARARGRSRPSPRPRRS